jgi:hypothetical protein
MQQPASQQPLQPHPPQPVQPAQPKTKINAFHMIYNMLFLVYGICLFAIQTYGYSILDSHTQSTKFAKLVLGILILHFAGLLMSTISMKYKYDHYGEEVLTKDDPLTKYMGLKLISLCVSTGMFIMLCWVSHDISIFPIYPNDCPVGFNSYVCYPMFMRIWAFSLTWLMFVCTPPLLVIGFCCSLCCGDQIKSCVQSLRRALFRLPNVGPFEQIHWFANRLPITDDPPDDKCGICFEVPIENDKWRELPCGHKFHPECIDVWLVNSELCPMCRQNAKTQSSIQQNLSTTGGVESKEIEEVVPATENIV